MSSPRSVFITGSSTGIGAECALRLDRAGWQVFAGVRRTEDADRLAAQASERLRPVLIDVTDPASVRAAVETVGSATGGVLHGLVNNAGLALGGPMEFVPMDVLRRQFEVNVFGLVAVTQAFLPLIHRGTGRLVNIGSMSGRVASPLVGPYAASKFAVAAISDVLRLELAWSGVQVSEVAPGVVLTPIWEKGVREVEDVLVGIPPEGLARYQVLLAAFRRLLRGAMRRGISADRVSAAVAHALTARRPRPRYLLGFDGKLRLLALTILPVRWTDALVLRVIRRMGTPR